jgi:hypothetical protein
LNGGITVAESGQHLQGELERFVWTGTRIDGTGTGASCASWSSSSPSALGTFGRHGIVTAGWSDLSGSPCSNANRLYCFEQ